METLEHMSSWRYSDAVEEARSQALLDGPPMSVVSDRVASEMKIGCCHRVPCDDHSDFNRVVFCLEIPRPLFDLFFNSPNGYRGAYYRSPYFSLEANDAFIHRLEGQLLGWVESHCPEIDVDFAKESLNTPSAKVWLVERGSDICEFCKGQWSDPQDACPEILNGRWESVCSSNGRSGRMAPCCSRLRISGAFLNDRYDEFVAERKRHRAMEIHQYGWS